MVGVFAGKYKRVYNSGSIRCDVGYGGCKTVSFKRSGARRQAKGTRQGEKGEIVEAVEIVKIVEAVEIVN